ncbi:hypothetical protein J7L06_00550 [Candidatus Bathyarchaeota archaeon]|nr:hypothetical protein [Candidatus Bathyarchaeota archaeon]
MSTPLLGKDAVIMIDTTEIGYAQGVRVGISADLIKEYKIGSDKPEVLKSGNKAFSVSFDAMYIDKSYAEQVLNGAEVSVVVRPAGTGSGLEEITISDVVLTSWELTISQDGVILESVEGEGKDITFGTQS